MRPYLFDWVINNHHLKPPTYGILLATAFSVGYIIALRRAIKIKENPKHVENLFLICVLSAIVGSRMFHVLFEEPRYYFSNPMKIYAVWEGGYTLFGGILTAMLGMFLYCRWKKLEFFQYGDIAAPTTAIGICIGRLGCFFAGCCWGTPTNLPWAVTFTNPDAFTTVKNIPLHPAQLYESFSTFLLYLFLTWRFKTRHYYGQIFFEGLLIYSIIRFGVEFFRGDEYRGFVFGGFLSYSQFVSLALLPFVVIGMAIYSKKKKIS